MPYRPLLPLVALLVGLLGLGIFTDPVLAGIVLADVAPLPPAQARPGDPQAPPAPAPTEVVEQPALAPHVVADVPPVPSLKGSPESNGRVWLLAGGASAVLIAVGLFLGLRRRKRRDD